VKNEKDTGHSLEAYFKRATSPLVVLQLLQERPMYVYELSQELKTRSCGGYTIVVLYPILYKLEEQGFVEVVSTEIESNRVRSYYGITQTGKAHYAVLLDAYHAMVDITNQLLQ